MARRGDGTSSESLSRSVRKLEQAHFHLKHLMREENKEEPVMLAVESYLGGCIGAVQAAFYNLRESQPDFKATHARFRREIGNADREFLNYMIDERDLDVHHGGTTLHRNFTIQPGGRYPIPPQYRLRGRGRAMGAAGACRRFIALMECLVEEFRR
jgi:hypothetical protein